MRLRFDGQAVEEASGGTRRSARKAIESVVESTRKINETAICAGVLVFVIYSGALNETVMVVE